MSLECNKESIEASFDTKMKLKEMNQSNDFDDDLKIAEELKVNGTIVSNLAIPTLKNNACRFSLGETENINNYFPKSKFNDQSHKRVKCSKNAKQSQSNSIDALANAIKTLKSREGKMTPTKSELTQQYSLEPGSRPISSQLITSMGTTSLLCSQISNEARARCAGSCKIDNSSSMIFAKFEDSQSRKTAAERFPSRSKIDHKRAKCEINSKVHPLYLRSCRCDEVSTFKMYKESDLGLDSEMLRHNIIDSFVDDDYDTDEEIMECSYRRIQKDLDVVFNELFFKGTETRALVRNSRF